MPYTYRARQWGILLAALLLSGCAMFGGKSQSSSVVAAESGPSEAEASREYEARLHRTVRSELRAAERREADGSSRIVFKKPYYFKEYSVYPGADEDYSIEFTEKESRTTPLSAETKADKIRFATRLHGKREDARVDQNFVRGTGTETVSYELRNGRWRRLGSLFVADKTEELVAGEWQPVRERAALPVLEAEEPTGWWRRIMFWR